MTPLRIYAVSKAKEIKSLPLAIFGSGALLGHAEGIIGDFFQFGRSVAHNTTELFAYVMGNQDFETDESLCRLPLAVAGFYIGSKALSFSYRSFKVGVKALRS